MRTRQALLNPADPTFSVEHMRRELAEAKAAGAASPPAEPICVSVEPAAPSDSEPGADDDVPSR